jgi:hypothetical protein
MATSPKHPNKEPVPCMPSEMVQEDLMVNELLVDLADLRDTLSDLDHVMAEKRKGLANVRQRIDRLEDPDPDPPLVV